MATNLFQPSLGYDELQAVREVFESNWIGRGKKTVEFEAAWAKHISALPAHVVATNCCTSALFEAVRLARVDEGDEVIIPSIHFVGAYNAIVAAGGWPVFCDVDEMSLNTTWEHIEPKISDKTKAVMLLNYGGVPCEIHTIRNNLLSHIKIIEDAACSPVSDIRHISTNTFSDFSVWSFDAMKVISTGDGGMLYCQKLTDAQQARKDLYMGMTATSGLDNQSKRWWEFEVEVPGARREIMNDIAAAIGLVQLRRLASFVDKRRVLRGIYNEQLKGVGDLVLPPALPDYVTAASYYFYWVQTSKRDELAAYLKSRDIYTSFRYYPLHWATNTEANLPNTERAARRTLLLPCHQSINNADYICQCVKDFYGR